MSSFYQNSVIGGPDAFVEIALGLKRYAAAMERKLLRELFRIVLGTVTPEEL